VWQDGVKVLNSHCEVLEKKAGKRLSPETDAVFQPSPEKKVVDDPFRGKASLLQSVETGVC